MIRSGLQVVDAQAKLAQSLGTTAASIQVLERAGELAGVSMPGTEQATKDLTRRLSQAATGTGPAVAALERLGPLAGALGGVGGGLFRGQSAGGELLAGIFHQGGVVGGPATERLVPAFAIAGAPRLHDGGMAGLRANEVPASLQRGEMVLSRAQVAAMGSARDTQRPVSVVMNITTPDAGSFRQSQGQIAADAARAIERARRNL